MYFNSGSIFSLVVLLVLVYLDVCLCKMVKSSDEHISNLDYVRPEHAPFQNFRLKNAADVLVPGKKGERKGSLHDVHIVTPPPLKKTKKAKDTLLKASTVPHVGYLDSNYMLSSVDPTRKELLGKPKPGVAGSKPRRAETEAERAERINKQFEKMLQFTALLGHVDSFLYDRTKSVVKTLHRMMGDSRELPNGADFENNELRRRRHSHDFYRVEPSEARVHPNEEYDPRIHEVIVPTE